MTTHTKASLSRATRPPALFTTRPPRNRAQRRALNSNKQKAPTKPRRHRLPILPLSEAVSPKYVIGNAGLREYAPYDRVEIWRKIEAGQFPPPVAALGTSPTAVKVWLRSNLQEWLNKQPLVKLAKEGGLIHDCKVQDRFQKCYSKPRNGR